MLIEDGNIEKANELLGRPFRISNIIVKDKMLGRTLGYPTANMIPTEGILLPKYGVYATNTIVDGKEYKSITNVGINPTIGDGLERIETYIIGYDGDVYDETIEVDFLSRIRDSVVFENLDALKAQLAEDEKVRLA